MEHTGPTAWRVNHGSRRRRHRAHRSLARVRLLFLSSLRRLRRRRARTFLLGLFIRAISAGAPLAAPVAFGYSGEFSTSPELALTFGAPLVYGHHSCGRAPGPSLPWHGHSFVVSY